MNQQNKYSILDITRYFLKLGTTGFGGPVALVNYMHRDLVESKQWYTEEEYKQGLAFSQLAPGPLAAQMSIFLGFIHHGIAGATAAGIAFVLPSFLMVLGIGWLYSLYAGIPVIQHLFFGIAGAVVGIILLSAYRLTKKSLYKKDKQDYLLWSIFLASAVVTFITKSESVWLLLGGGFLVWVVNAYRNKESKPTPNALPILLAGVSQVPVAAPQWALWGKLAWFFTKAGAFVFGSGLAIVPFLYGGLVEEYQWLTEQQFLDAVAVAMVTPGPVVITVGFIGYLVAGLQGSVIAALATFLPCYLITVVFTPVFIKHGKNKTVGWFIAGITAAAVGALAGAALVIGMQTISHGFQLGWCAITIGALLATKKLNEPLVILISGVVGLCVYPLLM